MNELARALFFARKTSSLMKGVDFMYNVKEVARMLNLNEETVRRCLRDGRLKGRICSKKKGYMIKQEDIDAFVESKPKYKNEFIKYSDFESRYDQDRKELLQETERMIKSLTLELNRLIKIKELLEEES